MAATGVDMGGALLRRAPESAVSCEYSWFSSFVASTLIERQAQGPDPATVGVVEQEFEEFHHTAAGLDI
jgi:hypothetical protein